MHAIITGAASGIGRAVARLAAESGDVHLLLADRDAGALESAAAEARILGADVLVTTLDVADPHACARLVGVAEDSWGQLDTLISNAGFGRSASLLDLTSDDFDASIAVNTKPTWLLGRAAHGMLSHSRGVIVATASMSAHHPTPPMGAYSTSKAALVMLVRQMAVEWGPDGIRCNLVSPGPTVTGMTAAIFGDDEDPQQKANRELRESHIPLRQVGVANDVARAILFLASSAAQQITGAELTVDGGLSNSLMPATGGGQGHRPTPAT